MSVFPVPGGPNRSIPFGNFLRPLKRSGLAIGQHINSITHALAKFKPAISSNLTGSESSKISDSILIIVMIIILIVLIVFKVMMLPRH